MQIIVIYPQIKEFYALGKNIIDKISNGIFAKESFDIIERKIIICNRDSCLFFVDGLINDEVMEKIIEFFYSINNESQLSNLKAFCEKSVPYVEVSAETDLDKIYTGILSGIMALAIDGLDGAIMLDVRSYPQRDSSEPEKDKVLRGSRDGFVETLVANTALVRRRIRDRNLRMKYLSAGIETKTDIVLCYMDNKVDKKLLAEITQKIENASVEALTMTMQSLSEVIYRHKWYSPFPKVKNTERPDVTASAVLDGNIAILIDNAPSALIIPTSIFDILEEADDYYFPPLTGTYIRLSRYIVTIASLFITPIWLLALKYPSYIPEVFAFIVPSDPINIPIFWQLMILELAIDGLRLAAINTPNMLSTPLSIIGAIVLSDFAVQSGWFISEAMLYMAFVAIANYSQPSYELGYAVKFTRIMILVLTEVFGIYGFIAGIVLTFIIMACTKTISGKSYLYPLIPFNRKEFYRKIVRTRAAANGNIKK